MPVAQAEEHPGGRRPQGMPRAGAAQEVEVTLDHTTHGLGRTRRWAHGDGRTGQVEHPLDDRVERHEGG